MMNKSTFHESKKVMLFQFKCLHENIFMMQIIKINH